ncbi:MULTISPECIES: class I SAM-dependent methyltransferase [Okeania]|uniref:Class I SAM-dependent methyltransferase n=1 Tax=Okeania hirsuta TaxID=1458930 RepID=A0A3N6PDI4_9CYAN|nr:MULTISPECIES: class I SAM-dependent methyltransferase [Okeania]NET13346.1 class I SAM-dependent methyltransferase [Okeania sp. SIO1H6]NES76140.1 class I SAM-dependent methyltransferase [Okeania sp. SIO1H4]NES90703.1 class I SAM-dependent methyltransferase [Okeania sp. SIO2B9]NET19583.1 class I SAM-dependent methyltransferase [Okeania sp. SIO1H5]NET75718.1 class I SAM-dependent methyltransferase [Okeania sp. SIO1F9]
MKVTPKQIETVYNESNAVEHYLSKSRRDGVKIEWEEPFSCSVFKRAIVLCNRKKGDKLKVLDVGSGTGDGYALLSQLLCDDFAIAGNYELDYLGVDISSQMVETARNIYANHSNARFECADIRTSSLTEPFDIYLSCGVPYSHLTHKELHQALKMIATNVCQHRSRCAVVVDVLGRYSIEWTPQWQESRWNYSMSFFESEGDAEATWMSFYSHHDLQEIMQQAMDEVGCPVERFEFFDRSIMVGRHTSTGQFNPKLPQYRNLVNSLLDSSVETDLSQLLFSVELGSAPEHILDFFRKFSRWWNTLVSQAAALLGESLAVESVELPSEIQEFQENVQKELSHISDPNLYRKKVELMLPEALRCLEATQQPGYGVGHDLFGVMWLDATRL